MDTIPKFKATCLAAPKRVRRTGRLLRVTRVGKPVADVAPPAPETRSRGLLGTMHGTATIAAGDIVAPASALADWDALR